MAVLRDLAEITHWISVVKVTPEASEDPTVTPDERARGQSMAEQLPMRVLTRMWQMLLKALEEVAAAPNAMMAAEMAIIRLTHVADLPSPEELVRKLQDTPRPPSPPAGGGGGGGGGGNGAGMAQGAVQGQAQAGYSGGAVPNGGGSQGGGATALAVADNTALARFATFEHVLELIRTQRDVKLLVDVEGGLKLASYQPGRIEFEPAPNAPRDLAHRLGSRLQSWTGNRWAVTVVNGGGAATVSEIRDAAENEMRETATAHPLVQAVLDAFPRAKITDIKSRKEITQEALAEALPEVEDEWDPFEED
jgi:DNA polymerase-3 subunit gamma/tau